MADDDLGLPKSTLLKAIKEQLPADVRLGGDAADALLRCCNEFVLMVSASANEISERQKRSTIMPDHIVEALRELGFDEYLDAVTEGAPAAGHLALLRAPPVACRLSPAPAPALHGAGQQYQRTFTCPLPAAALSEYKDTAKEAGQAKRDRKASRPGSNYTPEELLRLQQELLDAAAERARALEAPVPAAAPLAEQQQQQLQAPPLEPPQQGQPVA